MCTSKLFGPNKNCLSARSAHCTSWDHISWGLAVFGTVSRVQSRFFSIYAWYTIICPVQPKLPQSMCVLLYFSTPRFGVSSFWVQKNRVSWKPNCMRAVKFRKNEEQIPSWKICVSQDFLDQIKTVYLRGLHIAILRPHILRPCCNWYYF